MSLYGSKLRRYYDAPVLVPSPLALLSVCLSAASEDLSMIFVTSVIPVLASDY